MPGWLLLFCWPRNDLPVPGGGQLWEDTHTHSPGARKTLLLDLSGSLCLFMRAVVCPVMMDAGQLPLIRYDAAGVCVDLTGYPVACGQQQGPTLVGITRTNGGPAKQGGL